MQLYRCIQFVYSYTAFRVVCSGDMKMTELVKISAEKREETGKGNSRKLRAAGLIPANIIGGGKSELIQLDPKLLPKAWKSGKTFELDYNGTVKAVTIKEIQYHAMKRYAIHADLMYV